MQSNTVDSALFGGGRALPEIVRAEGIRMWDADGREYIDSTSGAISVISVGHGRQEVVDAMAEQGRQYSYAQGGRFRHPVAEQLAAEITKFTPGDLNRAMFVSGGSEANETAIKLARQYHLLRGNADKHIVIGRERSYHGNTLGALSASGYEGRRAPYIPMLQETPRVVESNCYRCPLNLTYPGCQLACAVDLERAIAEVGADRVSAFIAEPIVGAAGAATTPPVEYFEIVRQICDDNDILFIADEVVTGMGRTGYNFGIDRWDVVPDIIVTAKGLSGGYAPLGAVLVSERIEQAFKESGQSFIHGYTYQAHPVACAAGLAVLGIIQREGLIDAADAQGEYFFARLADLKRNHSIVGDVRGAGLLAGVELVSDQINRTPFPPSQNLSTEIVNAALRHGIMVYPCNSGGGHSDQFLISPPLIVTRDEIDEIVSHLDAALDDVEAGITA